MKFYLIATGAYSDYQVEALALHERTWTQPELVTLREEVIRKYVAAGYDITDYSVDMVKLRGFLTDVLRENGFTEAFISGEFHYDDYSRMKDIEFISHNPFHEGAA